MSPQLILIVAQLLLKYGPALAQDFVTLFHKGDPTLDDWNAMFDRVKTYDEYVAPLSAPVGSAPAPMA